MFARHAEVEVATVKWLCDLIGGLRLSGFLSQRFCSHNTDTTFQQARSGPLVKTSSEDMTALERIASKAEL